MTVIIKNKYKMKIVNYKIISENLLPDLKDKD